ncbi:MAG TPA: PQQ-binding-like beta-propeller repeat protein [Ignavibacteriaceae bacterium]|nr:PQQ-binding-like beta-propeller repeat protein [Ignavibacteriaceae bacterium]
MKKFSFLIICFLLFAAKASSQDYKYAWIINPQIGKSGSDTTLSKIINSINQNNELEYVIVSGNITMHGLNSEIETAKELLNKLRISFYVIPGKTDLGWSETAGVKFLSTFTNGHFYFNYNNTQQLGVNSSIIWREGGGHFSPEELDWASGNTGVSSISNEIFIYSYFPFDLKLDNWFQLTNFLIDYNFVVLFNSVDNEKTISNSKGFYSITGVNAGNSKDFYYNIIENKSDSLLFFQAGTDNTKLWGGLKKTKPELVKVKDNDFFEYESKNDKSAPGAKDSVLWQIDLKETSSTDLLTDDGCIYSVSKNGNVYCFRSDGTMKWKYNSNENIVSRPIIGNNLLVLATLQGDLISLDKNSGKVVQIIGIAEPLTSQLIKINIEYNGRQTTAVVVGTSNGNLYCYDIFTFEMIWENNSAQGLIRTLPLDIGHRLFWGSQDGFLYSADDRTGTLYWKWKEDNNFFTTPVVCPPVSDGKYIYISTPDKFVNKIDLLLGITKWRKDDFSSWESIGITNDNKYLIIKSISNNLYFINTSNGKKYKEIKMDYGFDLNPNQPIEWKGNILFGSEKGTVYLINNKYKWEPLFFMGNCRLNSIQHLNENRFVVSNMDGKITCFELK